VSARLELAASNYRNGDDFVWRRENGTWKVTHRHGDPITTMRSAGSVLQE
jgi:hypothetical protein